MVKIIVIGGGAAGFFGAIHSALQNPKATVILLEKTRALLAKVRVSGGGRCNVTHACFDPELLVRYYPRGYKALLGPFHRFSPKDTMQWFESHGVPLKIEADGRVFPVSNSSESIISCLMEELAKAKVTIQTNACVTSIHKEGEHFKIFLENGLIEECDKLLVATGGNHRFYSLLEALGHTIVPAVPSLFTFSTEDKKLHELSGVAHSNVRIGIKGSSFVQMGALLITHFGFSGPAALKLSAFAARYLHEKNYHVELTISWAGEEKESVVKEKLLALRESSAARIVVQDAQFGLAKSLWSLLLRSCGILEKKTWQQLSNKEIHLILEKLFRDTYKTCGKTLNKEEFVTAGGVSLDEVDFKTMQSKVCKGLFFAGEVLDIDGVTGGFNFQNAWTTAWIAAQS